MMEFDFTGIIPAIPGLWNGMLMTLQLMVLSLIHISEPTRPY